MQTTVEAPPLGSSIPATPDRQLWSSAIQFGASTLAILILWGMALSALIVGLVQQLGGGDQAIDNLQLFMMAFNLAFCGLLILPSSIYSLARLIGYPQERFPAFFRRLRPTLLIFVFPLLAGIGYRVSQNASLNWLLLPPIHVLAISLSIVWLMYLAVRDLPLGSPQRISGVFTSGLALAPVLIMFAEVAAIVGVLVLMGVLMAAQPELAEAANRLAEQLQAIQSSPEAMLHILQPVVNSPAVIFSVVVFGAVIVPLIEELIKPVGVWLLAGRRLTPAEGFAIGALSGAGYALVESLFLASAGQEWAMVIFARLGTSAVHILTAGLMGWALVVSWTQSKYLRLGAIYLLAVLIHGLWNGLTIASALASLSITNSSKFSNFGQAAPYALAGLAGVAFLTILLINRGLKIQVDKGNAEL
jgi:PrsW family intramembrane metalloprotease